MANFHEYFISSLPTLNFPDKPALTFQKFISLCSEFIPAQEREVIENVSISGEYLLKNIPLSLRKWYEFDIALRNELAKIRANRKHLDAAKYLRDQTYLDINLMHFLINTVRNPALEDVEKAIDLERWRFLDELSFGHYFDFDLLIIYALKLKILERWEKIIHAKKEKALQEVLLKI